MKNNRLCQKLFPIFMMVCLLGLGLLFPVKAQAADVTINSTNFPDSEFMAYVKTFDLDSNGKLSTSELGQVTKIDLSGIYGIATLKGIENFPSLQKLNCSWQSLTQLDVSSLTELTNLDCSTNELVTLNVSGCRKLTSLDAHYNQLKQIDLSANTALTKLDVGENQLTALDLSKNTALVTLECIENKLYSLDLTKNTKLTMLDCRNNRIGSLNLSGSRELKYLYCEINLLTELDISANTKLEILDCWDNDLEKVDISKCSALVNAFENGSLSENTSEGYDSYVITDSSCVVLGLVEADRTTAIHKPAVTMDPVDQKAVLGDPAVFLCKAKGGGLSYQWIYSDDYGATWKTPSSSAAKKSSYKLTTGSRHDGYRYMCKIVNKFGTSYSKTVTLQVAPMITVQPQKTSVALGKTATFSITAEGAGSYQWQTSSDNGAVWTNVTEASGKTAVYTFTTNKSHASNLYRCIVYSPKTETETVSDRARLNVVLERPVINTQPKSVSVPVGEKATFTIKATGDALSYQWWYRTSETGSWTKVTAASGTKATYSLTTKAKHNGYQYRCVVTNPMGKVNSDMVTLKVKPKITVQPTSVSVKAGKTATFSVTAENAKTYQWYYRTSSSGAWKAVSAASGKTAAYSLTTAARHNGYQYRCKVSNATSYVYTNIVTLKVK